MTLMKKAGLATLIAAAMLANAAMAKVGADQARNLGLTATINEATVARAIRVAEIETKIIEAVRGA